VAERCRGCGLCIRLAPHTFALDTWRGTARVVAQDGDSDEAIEAAAARCPFGAIQYT
jgi:ferredoxin